MRIGIVCYPTHGGSGVVASELGVALAHRGHQVHIISYAVPFRLREFHPNVSLHEVDIAVYPLFKYPPYELGLSNKIVEVAQEHGLDIIHAHYAVPHAASAYLAKQILNSIRLKTLTTLHGTDITSGVSSGLRLISTANSVWSFRRPKSCRPIPIGRTRGSWT